MIKAENIRRNIQAVRYKREYGMGYVYKYKR